MHCKNVEAPSASKTIITLDWQDYYTILISFQANFHNLDDYIAYEYLAKVSLPGGTSSSDGQPRTITLSFPVGSGVRNPGFYRFIYFSQPNNDVRSVLGKLSLLTLWNNSKCMAVKPVMDVIRLIWWWLLELFLNSWNRKTWLRFNIKLLTFTLVILRSLLGFKIFLLLHNTRRQKNIST